jgi:polyhydroxybutyrate depolymerase
MRVGRVTVALLVGVVSVAGACRTSPSSTPSIPASTTTTASAGTDTAASCTPPGNGAATGTSRRVLPFGGIERTYLLHLPPGYDGTRPIPLVFSFHGHGSSAEAQLSYADFRPLAARDGFGIVAPDGQGRPRHFTLLGATAGEADDVAFAVAVLDDVARQVCVDRRRVYATGMSNGGALSSVIACRAADRFAAVGAVAAIVFVPPCVEGGRPAPIVAVMGTADPIVPFTGGRVACCGNPAIAAAPDTMEKFARRSACEDPPTEDRPSPSVLHRVWLGCAGETAVEFYVVEGGGHTWPGASFERAASTLGATSHELVATEVLWAFFQRHRLPTT